MRPLLCATLATLLLSAAGCGGGAHNSRGTHRAAEVGGENEPEPEKLGPKPNTLTPQETADGWILLFDGKTTLGWTIDGDAEVKDGVLVIGDCKQATAEVTARFGSEYEVALEWRGKGKITAGRLYGEVNGRLDHDHWDVLVHKWDGKHHSGRFGSRDSSGWGFEELDPTRSPVILKSDGRNLLYVRSVKLRTIDTKPPFDG